MSPGGGPGSVFGMDGRDHAREHAAGPSWFASPPAPVLRPYVDGYLGYRQVAPASAVHRGLPSPHLTFIVSIGPPIDVVAQTARDQAPDTYRCVVSGLQATHALIARPAIEEGVAIELTPAGARALFGVPARALWNRSLELSDVVGPVGDELWERLQAPLSWPDRFAVCDAVLGRLMREPRLHPELDLAWRTIVSTGGAVPVARLAAEVGWTRQHLARRFQDEFGLRPKLAGRIVRFDRARRLLQRAEPGQTLADVAARAGYYDQAHLDRDFAAFAGCSPTAWRRAEVEVPSVQDDREFQPSS
jgi:AraC-like DNA-binding protein